MSVPHAYPSIRDPPFVQDTLDVGSLLIVHVHVVVDSYLVGGVSASYLEGLEGLNSIN